MFKRVALALLLTPLVSAKPLKPAPVVVKTLSSRYKLPTPVSSAGMTSGARDLADYVQLQQRFFPGAVVTAGFYDWRTTSRYRGHAGLHLGYDVAMPYGCPFSAGWAGTVTSIALWSGEEYGITVQHPDGSSVTYGHVSPKVSVGQHVLPGEAIGTIAYNHVDVKMRDSGGNYVDFGGNGRVLPAPQWAVEQPVASREMVMANWLLAQNTLEMAEEDYRNEKLESEKRRIQLQALRQKIPALKESQSMMADYVEQGLVSRLTSEENHEELEHAQKELARMEKARTSSPGRTKQLQKDVESARNRLNDAKKMAAERGISWKQVQGFVQATIANDKALSKNVQAYKKNALTQNASKLAGLEQELKRATDTLNTYEELFEMGGISRNELNEARTKQQILQAQVKAIKGSTGPSGHD